MFNFQLIIIILLLILFILLLKKKMEGFNNDIPKIIHQTAPADKTKWNDIWFKCQESWKKHFPDFEYKMWTDEDLDQLIKNDFLWFYEIYEKYDKNIKRIDIARYFILHKYGGIYADMDYICFKNFYDLLPKDKVSIAISRFPENEYMQNALMISPKEHPFWMNVIKKATERYNTNYNNGFVLDATGPRLIDSTYEENKDYVNPLPVKLYNAPMKDIGNDENYASHYSTLSWG
jgi:mannosyltransferase OCH1-like enzyme